MRHGSGPSGGEEKKNGKSRKRKVRGRNGKRKVIVLRFEWLIEGRVS